MAFGSCFSCIKYSVFIFNFLLWLMGCSLLAVGGWLLADDNVGRHVIQLSNGRAESDEGWPQASIASYSQVTDNGHPVTLAWLFIAFGSIIIVIAFIGCCGAVRESRYILGAFFVSLFLVFCIMLGVGIWAFVVRSEVDAHTLQRLTNRMIRTAIRDYYTDPESANFMDKLQKQFKCCGADNAAGDYMGRGSSHGPPCLVAFQRRSCLPVYFNHVGNHIEHSVKGRLLLVASVSIGTALCLVVAMMCVLLLICAVRERRWTTSH